MTWLASLRLRLDHDSIASRTGGLETGWHPSRRAAFLKLSYAWGRGF